MIQPGKKLNLQIDYREHFHSERSFKSACNDLQTKINKKFGFSRYSTKKSKNDFN